jgi:hypothetical protein
MNGANIQFVASSGMFRVTVHPRPRWYVVLAAIGVIFVSVLLTYRDWAKMSVLLHLLYICGFISAALALIYHLSGTQVVEFAPQTLTVCKEIHGWERKKEYKLEDCHELEWAEASEDCPAGLKCKVGWRTVAVVDDLSEDEAIEILTALQTSLPDVAQKLCSYPNNKEHFTTLGLNK